MSTSVPVMGSSLLQVREALLELFGSELGIYTLPTGARIPAFYVVGPGQVRPDWKVEGTECVLINPPGLQDLGGVGTLKAGRIWTLQFRCYDTTQTLEGIQLLAYRAWPRVQPRRLPQTDDTYEQLTYELFDAVLIQPL
jgi:hypothetical protein